ncbi:unnamed protein product, partial [marine sediment metagenome]
MWEIQNYFPLLEDFYKSKRSTLLNLLQILDLHSSTQQDLVMKAMSHVLDNRHHKTEYLDHELDLSFTTDQWRKLIIKKEKKKQLLHRRNLEICTLSHVANDLRSGDLFVLGADFYADYRKDLLPWEACEKLLDEYCQKVSIASSGHKCVAQLKEKLINKAQAVDDLYPELT